MGLGHGAGVVRSGLVLYVDAANKKSSLKTVEVLVVAGGGAGVSDRGGGGGGGGVLTGTSSVTVQNYSITVGAGGVGKSDRSQGNNGGNSIAFGLTALGGGGGGTGSGSNGSTGGSGGGAGNGGGANLVTTGGLGTPGQGHNGGGSVYVAPNYGGGGGGGAAGPGQAGTQLLGGDGGPGISSSMSGTLTYYGGGGGGGSYGGSSYPAGIGGIGGGGNGSVASAESGAPNTGGGGGSSGSPAGTGTSGGSGIVIVRYPGSQRATGGTVTFIDGYTIHTFTTSGTFTPNGAPGSGTVWTDFSNNGNSGIITNGVGYNSANGGSFVFDGVDDTVNGTISGSIFTGSFTQTAWIYKLNTNQIWQGVFTNSSPATNNTYLMTFGNGSVAAPFNSVGANQVGVSENGIFLDVGTHTNRWLYIVMTKTGSTLNIYCYKDGTLLQTSGTITWNGGNFATTNNYQIGRHWATGLLFQGNISQISMYNRALSATEIKQNFNATRGRYGV